MITNTITQIRDKTTKNKNKKQRPTNKQSEKKKKKAKKIKNNRKVKAMGKITPTMDHYPRNG